MKNRKRNRMMGFDYSSDRLYFVTICVKDRICCLGSVISVGAGRDLPVHVAENSSSSNSSAIHSSNPSSNPSAIHSSNSSSNSSAIHSSNPSSNSSAIHSSNPSAIHSSNSSNSSTDLSSNSSSSNSSSSNSSAIHSSNSSSNPSSNPSANPSASSSSSNSSEIHSSNPSAILSSNSSTDLSAHSSDNNPSEDCFSMQLNPHGLIVENQIKWLSEQYEYVEVHNYVVMPNHMHLIIEIDSSKVKGKEIKIKSLSSLMGALKTTSSKLIHENGLLGFAWQRSFHDHIIRHDRAYQNISNYIDSNPQRWIDDLFFEKA